MMQITSNLIELEVISFRKIIFLIKKEIFDQYFFLTKYLL